MWYYKMTNLKSRVDPWAGPSAHTHNMKSCNRQTHIYFRHVYFPRLPFFFLFWAPETCWHDTTSLIIKLTQYVHRLLAVPSYGRVDPAEGRRRWTDCLCKMTRDWIQFSLIKCQSWPSFQSMSVFGKHANSPKLTGIKQGLVLFSSFLLKTLKKKNFLPLLHTPKSHFVFFLETATY